MLARRDYQTAAGIIPPAAGVGGVRLSVFESHGDQVLALPPGAESLASSDSAVGGGGCLNHQFTSSPLTLNSKLQAHESLLQSSKILCLHPFL